MSIVARKSAQSDKRLCVSLIDIDNRIIHTNLLRASFQYSADKVALSFTGWKLRKLAFSRRRPLWSDERHCKYMQVTCSGPSFTIILKVKYSLGLVLRFQHDNTY